MKIASALRFFFGNFGPLIVFFAVNHFAGLKPAIVVSTIFSLAEIALKLHRGEPITLIFKFTAGITLIFGLVDLYAQHSFLFKYESVVTNLMTGMFFAATLFAQKSILQEYYEKSGNPKPMTPDRVAYFRLLTIAWVAYFFIKAGAYLWIARRYSLERAMVIRSIAGSGSLYAMLFISIVGSRKIFPLLKKWKLLPEEASVETQTLCSS